jgi:hypothetical protein
MPFIVGQEACLLPKGVHHCDEVMGILDAEMLVDGLDARRTPAVADRWHRKPPPTGAPSGENAVRHIREPSIGI